jgi:hypothetical protein
MGWARRFLLALAILLGMLGAEARAMPIRASLSRWEAYIAEGPRTWPRRHAPPVTRNVREAMLQAIQVSHSTVNPFVAYLEWRRSRDPANFDYWHPRIGPMLAKLLPPIPITEPQTIHKSTRPSHPVTPGKPPHVVPPGVPEPNTLAMAAGLIATGLWWRKRLSRSMNAPRP